MHFFGDYSAVDLCTFGALVLFVFGSTEHYGGEE